jgi:hypothetical protein
MYLLTPITVPEKMTFLYLTPFFSGLSSVCPVENVPSPIPVLGEITSPDQEI